MSSTMTKEIQPNDNKDFFSVECIALKMDLWFRKEEQQCIEVIWKISRNFLEFYQDFINLTPWSIVLFYETKVTCESPRAE